jgi:hypothetical protein
LRFAELDYTSFINSGYYNALNCSNEHAFATLQADGSITAWGDSDSGGTGAPDGNGYTKIYSTAYAFAALKADGSITSEGAPLPPLFASPQLPHAVIDPSALRAIKVALSE